MAETIVVGFDGSDGSARALARAVADAKHADGQLLIVVVAELPVDVGPPAFFSTPAEVALESVALADAVPPALQPTVDRARELAGTAVDFEIVPRMGDPAREILDAARDRGATEIVLGPHHHRHFEALFGEDVSAAIERDAKCRVVTVE